MGAAEIFYSFFAFTALVICWLLWEIHQKLHRLLELNLAIVFSDRKAPREEVARERQRLS